MSDPSHELFQKMKVRPMSGDHLEVLGKKAAADWLGGHAPSLTEAVVSVIKTAQAGLSPEQVKRVVEFANTDAFLREFKKEGAGHRVVDFGEAGPAGVGDVLGALNQGGHDVVSDRGTADYREQPPETKVASARAEHDLFALFAPTGPTEFPEHNPYEEVMELRDKLAAAEDNLGAQVDLLEVLYAELADRLYGNIKQAALSGTSLGEILQAWQDVTPSAEYVKVAFQLFTPRLLREGVFHSHKALGQSIEKTGQARMVNQAHPLVAGFREYCDTLAKLAELRPTREDLRTSLGQMTNFLKHAGLVDTVERLHEGSKAIGKKVAPVLSEHLGPGAGRAAELAGAAAVPVAGLIGANEVRRKLKHSPTANRVMSVVPGTDAYQQREWELMQRGGF